MYSESGLLRAIIIANGNGVPDVICLTPRSTYTLTMAYSGELGLPAVTSRITIKGFAATLTRVTSGSNYRILNVSSVGDLLLDNVTISNGRASLGGGVFSQGELILDNVVISTNSSTNGGGGIYNQRGTVDINNSTISGNTSLAGAGLYNFGNESEMVINKSRILSNEATGPGGGLFNFDGTAAIFSSSFLSNSASKGGGIQNGPFGTTRVSGSNITVNSAEDFGGGLSTDSANLTARFNCVNGNFAPEGANAFNGDVFSSIPADVEENWWGRSTGPVAGDAEVAGSLDFTPFLTSKPSACAGRTTSTGIETEPTPRPQLQMPPPYHIPDVESR